MDATDHCVDIQQAIAYLQSDEVKMEEEQDLVEKLCCKVSEVSEQCKNA